MSTEPPMRERIALALATAIDYQTEWDSLTLEQEGWIFELVDAVLDAMREPSEQMTKAARASGIYDPRVFMFAWALAIDAAKEGK